LKSQYETFATILFIFIAVTITVGPVFGPGQSTVTDRLPEQTPQNCIAPPERPTNPTDAEVVGTVTRQNQSIVLSYSKSTLQADISDFAVNLPLGATLESQRGFESGEFSSSLFWNESAANHTITYRMSELDIAQRSSSAQYPSDENWILAGVPEHRGAEINLSTSGPGYIGSGTLYLGEYRLHETQVGCQQIQAIVPKAARLTDIKQRLRELKVAAKSLPVNHQYRTVRVFVSPKRPGAALGFVKEFENEIVVVDHVPQSPSSVTWIHEYVHTVQDIQPKPEFAWFIEGSAQYLSLRIAVEHGFISPRMYDLHLLRGSQKFGNNMTNSIHEPVAYDRGAVMLSILDRELYHTHNRTVIGLLYEANNHRNPGINTIVRWLRDDVGMSAHGAQHTTDLIRDSRVLDPPTLMDTEEFPRYQQQLLYLGNLWETRLISGVFALLLAVSHLYDSYFREESEDTNQT
jgi:hypothetical protein